MWGSVVLGNNNPRYDRTMKAIVYLTKKYEEKIRELEGVKKDIVWLKTLATSDLFWDPIVKIEKVIMEKLLRRLNNSRRLENDVERTKEDGWLALWSSF